LFIYEDVLVVYLATLSLTEDRGLQHWKVQNV